MFVFGLFYIKNVIKKNKIRYEYVRLGRAGM